MLRDDLKIRKPEYPDREDPQDHPLTSSRAWAKFAQAKDLHRQTHWVGAVVLHKHPALPRHRNRAVH